MLSFKATAAVFDAIGSCYWLVATVAITWSLENSRARDYREPAQANFSCLTASLHKRPFRLHFRKFITYTSPLT